MEGFDRDALVKSTQPDKGKGALVFWGAVAALPVLGIAAGFFLMQPNDPAPAMQVAASQPEVDARIRPVMPAAPAPQKAEASRPEPGFSATAQLRRYGMVQTTLSACAKSAGPAKHYLKASATYRDQNSGKLEPLRQLALGEPPEHDMSAFDKDIPTDTAGVMVAGMTGQLARNALQRQSQFTAMMADAERQATGYLGPAPATAECTQFRNEVIMGKHSLTLPG
ncbi:MAG: hypothetical protein RIB03_10475 [Henriciella sp.]|uniref:hypothetical protein n=1 Tax=Henriciella sp. TaxID=1968823 RepID=UPI0032EB872F